MTHDAYLQHCDVTCHNLDVTSGGNADQDLDVFLASLCDSRLSNSHFFPILDLFAMDFWRSAGFCHEKRCLHIGTLLSLFSSQVHEAIFQTPEYGITYDTASAIKHTSRTENANLHQGIGWFMTIVQLDTNETLRWSEYSQGESLYSPLFLLLFLTFSFHFLPEN